MTAANSTNANSRVRGGLSFSDVRTNERLIWTATDGARIFVIIKRKTARVAFLRCHHGDRTWTRRQEWPLFPSMRPGHWTPADVKEEGSR